MLLLLPLQVMYMTGWSPHPSQPKARPRGSATVSFQVGLGVRGGTDWGSGLGGPTVSFQVGRGGGGVALIGREWPPGLCSRPALPHACTATEGVATWLVSQANTASCMHRIGRTTEGVAIWPVFQASTASCMHRIGRTTEGGPAARKIYLLTKSRLAVCLARL